MRKPYAPRCFGGVLAFFAADNRFTKAEQALLRKTFGEEEAQKAIDFVKEFGRDKVMGKLEKRLQHVCHFSAQGRKALYEDLERFAALASGNDSLKEEVLRVISDRLDINTTDLQGKRGIGKGDARGAAD